MDEACFIDKGLEKTRGFVEIRKKASMVIQASRTGMFFENIISSQARAAAWDSDDEL